MTPGSDPGAEAGEGPADLGLRIGVSELRRQPGNRRELRREVPLGGLSITTAEVPAGTDGHLDVVLESLTDGVTVTGSMSFEWVGPCRRCLEMTGGTEIAPIREVFSDNPTSPDLLAVEGDTIDLGPVVRDAVVLALPLAPLCRDDCPGPDPEHFPVGTEGDAPPADDPRWQALSELRFDPADDDG